MVVGSSNNNKEAVETNLVAVLGNRGGDRDSLGVATISSSNSIRPKQIDNANCHQEAM